jgi:hypothetical protein
VNCEFTPDSLIIAYREMKANNSLLLAFNTGIVSGDKGNINEHFMIDREYAVSEDGLNGEIFDLEFNHLGVDNLLWAKVSKLNRALRSTDSVVNHYHFSKGAAMDDVYKIAWNEESVKKDRELLKKKLELI